MRRNLVFRLKCGFRSVLVVALLSACATPTPTLKDSGPARPVDVSHIPDAVPRAEPRTRAGNKSPYTVLGKTYYLLPESRGFTEEGIASWYGNKFHGRQTSNGEIYSMYGMTAAHKRLPIPSYVRVTNLNNGREIVVRVNDRGPFHEGRIIDLTYAGASKLGFIKQGTAPVRIEVLEPGDEQLPSRLALGQETAVVATAAPTSAPLVSSPASSITTSSPAPAPKNSAGYQLPANTFLQAGAFASVSAAEQIRQQVAGLTQLPVFVTPKMSDELYRVRIGPIVDNRELMGLRARIEAQNLPPPHIVYH